MSDKLESRLEVDLLKKNVNFNIRIPEKLRDEFQHYCRKRSTKASLLTRDMISDWVQDQKSGEAAGEQ